MCLLLCIRFFCEFCFVLLRKFVTNKHRKQNCFFFSEDDEEELEAEEEAMDVSNSVDPPIVTGGFLFCLKLNH